MSSRSTQFQHFHNAKPAHGSISRAKHVKGPFNFLNPTRARFQHSTKSSESSDHGIEYAWSSRNNRKGRHALVLSPSVMESSEIETPAPTCTAREILKGLWRMVASYPVWDVSWLVAVIFTLGSVVWVINAFFEFLPYVQPSLNFKNEVLYSGGITAFVGATIFEVGSIFLMLEAINEDRTACFGWAVEKAIDNYEAHRSKSGQEHGAKMRIRHDWDSCGHHHKNQHNLVGRAGNANTKVKSSASSENSNQAEQSQNKAAASHQDGSSSIPGEEGEPDKKTWQWYPSRADLKTRYLHELGFLACSAQMIGASIFWTAGLTALPGINNKLSLAVADVIYWTTQVVGGSGFIISGTLFMVETQTRWWKPAPRVLGWHIGAWNLVGGVGFTLSAVFGYWAQAGKNWGGYQASLSTFWGSWAFLVGSAIQWYESLDKHPVEARQGY